MKAFKKADTLLAKAKKENSGLGRVVIVEDQRLVAEFFSHHCRDLQLTVVRNCSSCREGLAAIPKVTLHTPMSEALSSGITCFEINGLSPKTVVERLLERKIVASDSPYAASYVRLTPGLLNTPEEVDRAVAEVKAIAT